MRRTLLALAAAAGLAIGASLPVGAIGATQVTLNCSDGTSTTLVVDADTLTGLTEAVQAMIEYPAGLTCALIQTPLVGVSAIAVAANEPFVVGGGRYLLPCDNPGLPGEDGGGGGGGGGVGGGAAGVSASSAPEGFYWVNLGLNVHRKGGDFVGTLNETIPEHQCAFHGHFTSKPTCLTIVGMNLAYVTSRVTQTSHSTFFNFFKVPEVLVGDYVRFSFEDNGNPGHQPPGVDDRLNGIWAGSLDSSCADAVNTPAPAVNHVHGNISVHP